jgi:anti-sigma factor RsiW
MDAKLGQEDFERLSAWMDEELNEADRTNVEARLASDETWRGARAEFIALDRALDAWAAPSPSAGLERRVLQRVSRQGVFARAARRLRYLVPLAAAACLVAAAVVYHATRQAGPARPDLAGETRGLAPEGPLPEDTQAFESPAALAELDEAIEDNLDFFRDMGVTDNFDTIEAIYQQQRSGT